MILLAGIIVQYNLTDEMALLTPPSFGHLPYCFATPPIFLRKHRARGLNSSSKKLLYNIIHPSQQNDIRQNEFLISPYISLLQSTEKELKIILSDNEDCIAFSCCERPTVRLSRILLLVH